MAGDWIPMRTDLDRDPAVIAVAASLSIDEFAVVGRLHRFWSWANSHSVNGSIPNVSVAWIDRFVCCEGFTAALVKVLWLKATTDGFCVPKFTSWNGKSAKRRLKDTVRRRYQRPQNVRKMSASNADKNRTRGEESREEKSKDKTPLPPAGGWFAEFWRQYPRKIAKPQAEKAYERHVNAPEIAAAVLAGLIRWRASEQWTKDGGQFIPHPATFLNQRRWDDSPEPEKLKATSLRDTDSEYGPPAWQFEKSPQQGATKP